MNKNQIIEKITEKKKFSELPLQDVRRAFSKFDKIKYSDNEKIKLTREFLGRYYSFFFQKSILNYKEKNFEWFLNKHRSTKERLGSYPEIYTRILKDFTKECSVYDLGCGVNGFSYSYLKQINKKISYYGIEAIGQLVEIQNKYFKDSNFPAQIFHESLFNLNKIKEILNKGKSLKIIFLFKVLDSLEMLKRDYSKEFLKEIVSFADLAVVSFATKSLIAKKNFKVSRNWIISFIKENFQIIDDFEVCSERYICFKKR